MQKGVSVILVGKETCRCDFGMNVLWLTGVMEELGATLAEESGTARRCRPVEKETCRCDFEIWFG